MKYVLNYFIHLHEIKLFSQLKNLVLGTGALKRENVKDKQSKQEPLFSANLIILFINFIGEQFEFHTVFWNGLVSASMDYKEKIAGTI